MLENFEIVLEKETSTRLDHVLNLRCHHLDL
jgi:hypothetical protein